MIDFYPRALFFFSPLIDNVWVRHLFEFLISIDSTPIIGFMFLMFDLMKRG